jgi:YjbR
VKLEAVRSVALALPETTEEPHHNFGSFRVRGKIFVTIPPDNEHIHVFVNEQDRELALAAYADFTEKLLWGSKVVGIRVALARAKPSAVKVMVRQAYEYKSAKSPSRTSSKRATRAPRGESAA